MQLLKHFGIRRQAKLDTADYLVFASDLESYSLLNIEKALLSIASVPRREGETAFPDIARILEAVRAVIRASRPTVPTSGERWSAHVDEFWKQPPAPLDAELKDKVAKLNSRFNLEKPQELIIGPPAMVECPHCEGILPLAKNLRFFSSAELRQLADLKEKSERIAAENRAAVHAPAVETVPAITEECA